MVTSAYRPIEFSGMSQAGALKGTFVLNICSAGQTNSYHHATPNITEVTPSYFEGTWRDCPAQGPTPGPSWTPISPRLAAFASFFLSLAMVKRFGGVPEFGAPPW
jgi:hypothetical protein